MQSMRSCVSPFSTVFGKVMTASCDNKTNLSPKMSGGNILSFHANALVIIRTWLINVTQRVCVLCTISEKRITLTYSSVNGLTFLVEKVCFLWNRNSIFKRKLNYFQTSMGLLLRSNVKVSEAMVAKVTRGNLQISARLLITVFKWRQQLTSCL
jgi:hypothetical protein